MATTALAQRSLSGVIAIPSRRHHFFDRSCFSYSPLASRSQGLNQGSSTALRLFNESTRRDASGAVRSGLRELLTGEHEQKAKETLEFYVHETRSNDPNDKTATLKLAYCPPNSAPFAWGSFFVFDNEVREGSSADSLLLGRERGWGAVADQEGEEGVQLMSKFFFTEGKYAGSTITFSGNVAGKKTPYELVLLGGTGHFRGAHGYALADNVPNQGQRFIFHWKVYTS